MIRLESATPGMILANDLKERGGRVLLGKGAEITQRHLMIFKAWGVTEVDVEGADEKEGQEIPTESVDPALLEEIKAQADDLFRHTDPQHAANRELIRLFTLRQIRKKSAGRAAS
ncbi:MAG: hypothetical protein U0V70_19515 [Terriglobia bacterium]